MQAFLTLQSGSKSIYIYIYIYMYYNAKKKSHIAFLCVKLHVKRPLFFFFQLLPTFDLFSSSLLLMFFFLEFLDVLEVPAQLRHTRMRVSKSRSIPHRIASFIIGAVKENEKVLCLIRHRVESNRQPKRQSEALSVFFFFFFVTSVFGLNTRILLLLSLF